MTPPKPAVVKVPVRVRRISNRVAHAAHPTSTEEAGFFQHQAIVAETELAALESAEAALALCKEGGARREEYISTIEQAREDREVEIAKLMVAALAVHEESLRLKARAGAGEWDVKQDSPFDKIVLATETWRVVSTDDAVDEHNLAVREIARQREQIEALRACRREWRLVSLGSRVRSEAHRYDDAARACGALDEPQEPKSTKPDDYMRELIDIQKAHNFEMQRQNVIQARIATATEVQARVAAMRGYNEYRIARGYTPGFDEPHFDALLAALKEGE